MARSWRFTFGLRALLAIVTVTCVSLAAWRETVATRLWIEPNVPAMETINRGYAGNATIVHGRFFCLNGSPYVRVRWIAHHTASVGESFSFRFAGDCAAQYQSAGFYTFAIEMPAIGPHARADIAIRTSTGATAQISLGDLSLTPATQAAEPERIRLAP